MKKNGIKVAVGLSGGVDSAVSAYLLKKEGFDVRGVHVICWDEGPQCKAREDRQDALKVALQLNIPFEVLDFQKEYKERVIDRFYEDYARGLTPNPDIWCNSEIKFGLFMKWAIKQGFDYLATGHYAKVQTSKNTPFVSFVDETSPSNLEGDNKVRLLIPKDDFKDQTYFLHRLGQGELKRVIFPLQDLKKTEVRKIAKEAGLPVAEKKDSVGICFVGDIDVQAFLRRRLKEQPGEVVDMEGEMVGTHKGVWFYTIGQRGGWEITPEYQKKFGGVAPIMYVVEKEMKNNRLVVGFGAETYRESFVVGDLSFIAGIPANFEGVKVRIRHGGKLMDANVLLEEGLLKVSLLEAERGIAPGQAAVFYKDGECLGGGVIL